MAYDLDNPFKEILARKSRSFANASNDAKRVIRWVKQQHFRSHLPLTFDCLRNLEMGDLRFLASQFRSYIGEEAQEWKHSDYVRFIAGVQHDPVNLIPADPIPFGELPVLKKAEGFGL